MREEKLKQLLNIIILVMVIITFVLAHNYERYGRAFEYPIIAVCLIFIYKKIRFHDNVFIDNR
jgi:hypothetical protein